MKTVYSQSKDYFSTLEKDETDMMKHSQNFITRQRLNREVQFTEDFKKRFMTKDYGNYEKYEKNKIELNQENGLADKGMDTYYKNIRNMNKQLHTNVGEEFKVQEKKMFEDILSNERYSQDTVAERYTKIVETSENLQ